MLIYKRNTAKKTLQKEKRTFLQKVGSPFLKAEQKIHRFLFRSEQKFLSLLDKAFSPKMKQKKEDGNSVDYQISVETPASKTRQIPVSIHTPSKSKSLPVKITKTEVITEKTLMQKHSPHILGKRFTVTVQDAREKKIKKERTHEEKQEMHVSIGKLALLVSLLVPMTSWFVFQTVLEPESSMANLLETRNYAAEEEDQESLREEKMGEYRRITGDIQKNTEYMKEIRKDFVLDEVRENRIDFLEIMLDIKKTSLKSLDHITPELNDKLQILSYQSYRGKTSEKGTTISISGSINDPEKKSLSKLTKLMDAMNADENFSGASLRNFKKSNTGESSFHFSFSYTPSFLNE